MEGGRRLTKFIAKFEFGANMTAEQAQEWIETVKHQLPEGAEADVKMVPLVLEVENLTPEFIGQHVSVYVDKRIGTVAGKLDAVYPSGRQGVAHTLIVEGTAYTVTYGLVTLSEW